MFTTCKVSINESHRNSYINLNKKETKFFTHSTKKRRLKVTDANLTGKLYSLKKTLYAQLILK